MDYTNQSYLNCPKCSREMEEGFIVDHGYGNVKPSDWVEGEPVKSFWYGTNIRDKRRFRAVTYRCVGCGFLESYATEKSEALSIFE